MKERTVRRVVGNFVSNLFSRKNKVSSIQPVKVEKKKNHTYRSFLESIGGKTHSSRGRFGNRRSSKLSNKLGKSQKVYSDRKMRQFAYQGLSKAKREIRIKNDLYLQICLYGKAI